MPPGMVCRMGMGVIEEIPAVYKDIDEVMVSQAGSFMNLPGW